MPCELGSFRIVGVDWSMIGQCTLDTTGRSKERGTGHSGGKEAV